MIYALAGWEAVWLFPDYALCCDALNRKDTFDSIFTVSHRERIALSVNFSFLVMIQDQQPLLIEEDF